MEVPGPLREVRSWEELAPDPGSDDSALEAMLLTVGEKGYAKTTVREVADRARIGEDRFHRRLGSKEECFARAYERAAAVLTAELDEACAGGDSWRGAFRADAGVRPREPGAEAAPERHVLRGRLAPPGRGPGLHRHDHRGRPSDVWPG